MIRRLPSNAKGRFAPAGDTALPRCAGPGFEVIDRRDGTLTKVTRGKIAVRDFRRRKTIIVRAGKSYLARTR